jgi:hypothetical protein
MSLAANVMPAARVEYHRAQPVILPAIACRRSTPREVSGAQGELFPLQMDLPRKIPGIAAECDGSDATANAPAKE